MGQIIFFLKHHLSFQISVEVQDVRVFVLFLFYFMFLYLPLTITNLRVRISYAKTTDDGFHEFFIIFYFHERQPLSTTNLSTYALYVSGVSLVYLLSGYASRL
jgi:hypothetical protein